MEDGHVGGHDLDLEPSEGPCFGQGGGMGVMLRIPHIGIVEKGVGFRSPRFTGLWVYRHCY